MTDQAAEVVSFWQNAGKESWYKKDTAFDDEIRRRFLSLHEAAAKGALDDWMGSAQGALALMILLDQFPRNMFRGQARMFATDEQARTLAAAAIERGFDAQVDPIMRSFFYLPYMHSEDLADQERCIKLYAAAGDADGLKWADLHADIVRKFDRFPHRNTVLGRSTTPEEQAFLDAGGFAG